jgi:recombination protein RecA
MSEARSRSRPVNPVATEEAPKKASTLQTLMGKVSKTYGPHVMKMASSKPPFRHIQTNILTMDMALLGGPPEGLITCLVGWQSSGKSTTAMRMIASAQRKYPDRTAVLIDTEGTYDPSWGRVHGIDNDKLVLVQPPSGEVALDIAEAVIRDEETSILVLDSLAQLVPVKEIEGAMEDQQVGLQARMINKFLRKAVSALLDIARREHKPAVVMVQQWRTKMTLRGDPRTMPGGMGQLFAYAQWIDIKNSENTDGKDDAGNQVVDYNEHSFTVKKNKVGNSIRNGEFLMVRNPDHPYGQGFIDDANTAVTFGRRFGLVNGGGSSWRINDVDERFSSLKETSEYFYSDLAFFDHFKGLLITEQRRKMGLLPDGWR